MTITTVHIREAKMMNVKQEFRPARDSNSSLVDAPYLNIFKYMQVSINETF